jgi:uncharacterized protein YbbC (DUF1343 family)
MNKMKNQMQTNIFIVLLAFLTNACTSQKAIKPQINTSDNAEITVGAAQTNIYLPLLQGKNVALVVNQTSTIGKTHLVDSLLSLGVKVKKIFSPEHGFRGNAEAGEKVKDGKDSKTGLQIVSLHGKKFKPDATDMQDIDVLVFDIQDVGVRFYTYISTLHYCMEACAENNKPLIVFDRPNPNGHYVDGPVLDTKFKSFVGLDPLPVVHGLTLGEFAMMANGEGFLDKKIQCNVQIIKCLRYSHDFFYTLPTAPSPNLKTMRSVYLYPSLCFFEGTNVSLGRGTDTPFEVIGYPKNTAGNFTFTPRPNAASSKPPLSGELCKGFSFSSTNISDLQKNKQLNINYLVDFYSNNPAKKEYFLSNNFIDRLAGSDQLRKMILEGKTAQEIRESWQPALNNYKEMSKKYLLYP